MKKGWPYLAALIAMFAAVCCLAIFVIIPKAALLTLPYRWNHIPVNQPRFLVHQYLGKPQVTGAGLITKGDEWIALRDNGAYHLNIQYSKDSAAAHYTLVFHYQLGFFKKAYLLKQE